MIIFGRSKEYVRHAEHVHGSECPYCHQQNSMSAQVLMRYAHVWYIPFFPAGKRVIVACAHCKAAYDAKQLPPHIEQQCSDIKNNTKYPLKYWTWSLLIVAVLALALILPLIN